MAKSTAKKPEQEPVLLPAQDSDIAVIPQNVTPTPVDDIGKVFAAINSVRQYSFDNFGDDKFQRLGLVSACKSANCTPLENCPEEGFELSYYYVHAVQVNSRDKDEYTPAIRTVLIDSSENFYVSLSTTVAQAVAEMVQILAGEPIPKGTVCKFESVKSGNRKVHKLQFVPPRG